MDPSESHTVPEPGALTRTPTLASSNSNQLLVERGLEDKRRGDDTGDCTGAAARRTQQSSSVPVVAPTASDDSGRSRHRERPTSNNKTTKAATTTTTKTKPKPNTTNTTTSTTRGFYSISENLGFKRGDREDLVVSTSDCDHFAADRIITSSIISENGDHLCYDKNDDEYNNDSQRDLNKCDPACFADYFGKIDSLNNDGDDDDDNDDDGSDPEVGGGKFVIKSPGVRGVHPLPPSTSPDDINNNAGNHNSPFLFADQFYSPPQKTRTSSSSSHPHLLHHPQTIKHNNNNNNLSSTHNQQQQQQQPAQTAFLSSFNLTLNLPERAETITQGFGVKMVATASCQQLMYRSVPPRPLSYTLTDVLEPKTAPLRSKTAPVSVNSPDDYVQRFKSRPTTRPRVIEFDGSTVSTKTKRLAMVSSGFPTSRAKVYIGHTKAPSPTLHSQSQTARSPGSRLHLAPLEQKSGRRSTSGFTPGSSRTMRTVDRSQGRGGGGGGGSIHGNQTTAASTTRATSKSAGSSIPDHGTKSTVSYKPPTTATDTIQSAEFSMSVPRAPTPDPEDHIHNPELLLTSNSDLDDLSILPRPKKVLPKRELPWVFRYKVKKGMNTLSRIMASKPAPNALHPNYSLT